MTGRARSDRRAWRVRPASGAADVAAGAPAPTVWEIEPRRRDRREGYEVIDPADDPRRDYGAIYDASGNAAILNDLIGRIRKGGEIVLAGFYPDALSFAFPPAFMKEARLRVAAEWTREDLVADPRR